MQLMQSMQCNAMHCIVNETYADVDVATCGGAWHEALYAREMHDLHKCI